MTAPLVGVTPIFAVCFWGYDLGKQWMKSIRGVATDKELSLVDIGIAGGFSAVPTTAIMAPGERIKCVMQVEPAGSERFKGGASDVVKHILREGGVRSLYRGTMATLWRDGTGSVAYFGVYEWLKRTLTPEGAALSPLAVVMAGGFAGVCNWIVAIPFDVIKSRIQTAEGAEAAKGMVTHAKEMLAKEGIVSLYRGAGPAMLRAFPANAACFLGVELSLSFLNKLF
jgi:solute carrier family 25 (mitochondrial carnitine/acylcarnitine transporter), member 20/29